MDRRIYLDYAATTPVDSGVFEAMRPYFSERFGNPGSLHAFGQDAIAAIDRSREAIAKSIGADFRQIIFTASATEANVLALQGSLVEFKKKIGFEKRPRVIISAIEHESVFETVRAMEAWGTEVVVLPVDPEGFIDEKDIKTNLTPETGIVSIMVANNEIGSVQSIASIAQAIKEFRGAGEYPLFHTDAAQAFQFFDCNVKTFGVDLMTISAHKIYGPKGAGALYVHDAKLLAPVVTGGGQEYGLRSGTENVPAIAGFAKAVELAVAAREKEIPRLASLRGKLWQGIKGIFPDAEINGPGGTRSKHDGACDERHGTVLPNILNVYLPGRDAQDILTRLDLAGLAASSGSACRSRAVEASHVIQALGHDAKRAKQSIRFSLGRPTTEEEIVQAVSIMKASAQ